MHLPEEKLYIQAHVQQFLQCYIQADIRLITAAAYGQMQLVQELLAARADADRKDHQVNHIKACMHSGLLEAVNAIANNSSTSVCIGVYCAFCILCVMMTMKKAFLPSVPPQSKCLVLKSTWRHPAVPSLLTQQCLLAVWDIGGSVASN